MSKIKEYTDNIAKVLFCKGYYILVYTDGSVSILQAQCYIGSSNSELGIQRALEYIEKAYDAESVAREIAAIKKSIKKQEAKLEELEEEYDERLNNLQRLKAEEMSKEDEPINIKEDQYEK